MRIVRWFGLILMLLAVVTGSAMLYMRYVVNSPDWAWRDWLGVELLNEEAEVVIKEAK